MDEVQEASEALAESGEQPTSNYTTPRITKVTVVVREQSQESSYFKALLDPGRGAYFQLKHHAYYVLYSI